MGGGSSDPTVQRASSPTEDELRRWGLEPAWSRQVTFERADGQSTAWHVLDTGPGTKGTVVCVHGNPTWAYLWRHVLHALSPEWRVIAVDQSGMGYSERTGPRRLADRVDELVRFVRQEVDGPVVLAAHDWGGPIAVGAAASLDVRALVLANTAVAKPTGLSVPPLIAAARGSVDVLCRRTTAFVGGAARMAPRAHREALLAPYGTPARRAAIADFVADIPVRSTDPSFEALAKSAATFSSLACPILLVWGGRDPVFHDRFLRDLRERAPGADVERLADQGHFVLLEDAVGPVIAAWVDRRLDAEAPAREDDAIAGASSDPRAPARSVLDALGERAGDRAAVYVGPDGTLSWADLDARSTVAASIMRANGVRRGSRVAMVVPPSVELLVAVVAVWKARGVVVAADASAGVRQLRQLLRATAPSHVVGTPVTLTAARLGRFAPGARALGFASLPSVVDLRGAPGEAQIESPNEDADTLPTDLAAVVHTSGATGPAKAVRYTHGALVAQRDALVGLLAVDAREAFTTSFGPFMLLAPALGMACVRPDFDVNAPSELTFDALAAAAAQAPVTTAWLSPASARTILRTAAGRRLALRLVMLAGAPIPASLAAQVRDLTSGDVRAPYGMTECLPVTDGVEPQARGTLGGTATGRSVAGCDVVIAPLDEPAGDGVADGVMGEILVSAPWMFAGYEARWAADVASSVVRDGRRFHRTGDVGYFEDGVLFQLGRRQHVLRTAAGPVASVGIETEVGDAVAREVAAVPVGPPGTAVVALVIEDSGRLRLAEPSLAAAARAATPHRVAAVLQGPLPVDRRHQSKVDRTALAGSVGSLLNGA